METYEILIIGAIVIALLFLFKKSRDFASDLLGTFANKASKVFPFIPPRDPPKNKT